MIYAFYVYVYFMCIYIRSTHFPLFLLLHVFNWMWLPVLNVQTIGNCSFTLQTGLWFSLGLTREQLFGLNPGPLALSRLKTCCEPYREVQTKQCHVKAPLVLTVVPPLPPLWSSGWGAQWGVGVRSTRGCGTEWQSREAVLIKTVISLYKAFSVVLSFFLLDESTICFAMFL